MYLDHKKMFLFLLRNPEIGKKKKTLAMNFAINISFIKVLQLHQDLACKAGVFGGRTSAELNRGRLRRVKRRTKGVGVRLEGEEAGRGEERKIRVFSFSSPPPYATPFTPPSP